MPEARIRTDFGYIIITYNNMEELNIALQGLDEQIKTISQSAMKIVPRPERIPKPGYEKAYRFSPTGKAELLIFPSIKVQLVALALFAYYPDTVEVAELKQVTGISDIVDKVLGQPNNKKYFQKIDNAYCLTTDGITLFMKKVKPQIDGIAESEQMGTQE